MVCDALKKPAFLPKKGQKVTIGLIRIRKIAIPSSHELPSFSSLLRLHGSGIACHAGRT
jgi:hypothetical protein